MPWQVVREIETHFVITVNGITNGAIARPRNKDTCRGDAPPTAIFDEAAFLQRAFWFDFAYPLFQVKDRIATLITTPPPPGGYRGPCPHGAPAVARYAIGRAYAVVLA